MRNDLNSLRRSALLDDISLLDSEEEKVDVLIDKILELQNCLCELQQCYTELLFSIRSLRWVPDPF